MHAIVQFVTDNMHFRRRRTDFWHHFLFLVSFFVNVLFWLYVR